jgi:hypothetical protein
MDMGYYAQLLLSACGAREYGMPAGNGHIYGIFCKTFSRVLRRENKIEKEFLCFS